jgi:hypothetical protein
MQFNFGTISNTRTAVLGEKEKINSLSNYPIFGVDYCEISTSKLRNWLINPEEMLSRGAVATLYLITL